ncbi:MAG: hypothetical protein ACN2B6_05490 [Rickettsiales bacterium]
MTKRELSPTEANAEIERLQTEEGLKVVDLRGKSAGEQTAMIAQLKTDIDRLMKERSLTSPLTLVTGSGKTNDPAVLAEAKEWGHTLGAIVNGGSQHSVMGAVAEGAKVKIGVTCEAIMKFEIPDNRYDILVIADGKGVYEGLEKRLELAREIAPKELAIQGGMGTMEEILGGIKKRGTLAVAEPYWQPLVSNLRRMYADGYIAADELDKVKVVNPHGTPIDLLSERTPTNPNAEEYRKDTARVAHAAKNILEQRNMKVAILNSNTPIAETLAAHDAFILAPGDIDTMLQAMLISVDKRLDIMKNGNPAYPGIKDKKLIVLNVDGFYDGFMKKWREMEKDGYLMESLADLNIVEAKLHSKDLPDVDIRAELANIVPPEKSARSARAKTDSSFRRP